MGELLRRIASKAKWYRLDFVAADRWFPSTKACSGCGHHKADLTLADRTCRCAACGLSIDRDMHAAVNLARWTNDATDEAGIENSPPISVAA